MATTTISTATSYATDAAFRTANQAISTAIQAVGLIQTSDTGQINWTTVLKPTVAFTFAGYEIYRFNDSLQSTSPIYIKILYGTGTSATYSYLNIQVGTATDGAGTILNANTGGNSSFGISLYSTTVDGATRTSYFSGSTNRLCMILWPPLSSGDWAIFSIERSHDSAGADTGTAAYILWSSPSGSGTNGASSQYLILGSPIGPFSPPTLTYSGWYCGVPLVGNGAQSPNIYTYPIRVYNLSETAPIFNMAHYASGDVSSGATVSITGYDGVARNYLAPGTGVFNSTAGYIAFTGAPLTTGLLMRYE